MNSGIQEVLIDLQSLGWLKWTEHFKVVDSTNSAAKRFAKNGWGSLPALFVTDEQTQGRGRGGHQWWSPRGCLMLTLALNSTMLPEPREKWSLLALLAGVAAAEAIEKVCPQLDIQLKWPNDLYLSGRKLGGILIESFSVVRDRFTSATDAIVCPATFHSSMGSETIFAIGIGINTAMNWQLAPPDVAVRATCISSVAGQLVSIDEILFELILSLSSRIDTWRSGGDGWIDAWHPRCLLSGKIVTLDTILSATEGMQRLAGRCEGVARDGRLLIRTENGGITAINVGEVVHWQS